METDYYFGFIHVVQPPMRGGAPYFTMRIMMTPKLCSKLSPALLTDGAFSMIQQSYVCHYINPALKIEMEFNNSNYCWFRCLLNFVDERFTV